jgi:hypothetical protein
MQLFCRKGDYEENYRLIMNGFLETHLYDCKRGQEGDFVDQTERDPTKAIIGFVRPGTLAAEQL